MKVELCPQYIICFIDACNKKKGCMEALTLASACRYWSWVAYGIDVLTAMLIYIFHQVYIMS